MRKLFAILTLVVSFFAMGCEEPSTDHPTGGVTFEFSNIEATSNSVNYTITPSDLEVSYFATVVESAAISNMSDAEIIRFTEEGLSVNRGVKNLSATGLKSETAYSIIAYAINSSTVSLQTIFTKANGGGSSDKFSVDINLTNLSESTITATAIPNDDNVNYFFRVITKIELDAFGIYNNDFEVFKYIIENPNSNEFIFKGKQTLEYTNLAPETDYIAIAFNADTYEDVINEVIEVELFRKEFKTPEAAPVDPDTLFTYQNLVTTHKGFTLDVTPAKGEESFWGYYIWTKEGYYDVLENEARANIVMRSYFGLNNLGVEHGYDFGTFMRDYMGQRGTTQILNYEPLKPGQEYVVVMFYLDPEVSDPTVVYDYNFVAVEFKTKEPSGDNVASLAVSEPIIEKDGFKYNINFVVKTDNYATDLLIGAQLWDSYDFEKYWDHDNHSSIQAFFLFRKPVSEETLAAAKTEEGAVVSFSGVDQNDYVFFFEVLNEENVATHYAVRVTEDLFN